MTEGPQTRGKRTERLQIMLNDDELGEIEDWRFIHRVNSRSSAIRLLIRLGLDASRQGVLPPEELPLGRPKP
ncbi:MAG: hypothetical protein ACMVO3_12630 [Thalassobaculum sp.]|jgi:metal-responsive CopG/Arc/MetJ family transcriptional regulator